MRDLGIPADSGFGEAKKQEGHIPLSSIKEAMEKITRRRQPKPVSGNIALIARFVHLLMIFAVFFGAGVTIYGIWWEKADAAVKGMASALTILVSGVVLGFVLRDGNVAESDSDVGL
jgi:hypothetical protein